ncbi:hypothetical protein Tco_0049922, partial [Tanacetum coccineum]
ILGGANESGGGFDWWLSRELRMVAMLVGVEIELRSDVVDGGSDDVEMGRG